MFLLIFVMSQHLTHEQPLNLVKKDRKRKPSSLEGNSDVVICKLCNSYVVQTLLETHNRLELAGAGSDYDYCAAW